MYIYIYIICMCIIYIQRSSNNTGIISAWLGDIVPVGKDFCWFNDYGKQGNFTRVHGTFWSSSAVVLSLMDIFLHQHVWTYEICPVSYNIQSVFGQLGLEARKNIWKNSTKITWFYITKAFFKWMTLYRCLKSTSKEISQNLGVSWRHPKYSKALECSTGCCLRRCSGEVPLELPPTSPRKSPQGFDLCPTSILY